MMIAEGVRRAPRRPPEWLVVAAVATVAAVTACLPRLREPLFYFWGDNSESFFPLWHHLGSQLRAGRWLGMDPAGWMGGNYAAEAAYGVFNPVTMADAVLISFFDDLSTGAFLVMTQFVVLLAVGVYLLAREYGAGRGPAAVVGVAAPFAGFTFFYEAGNWASGLMAFTWLVHFWWSARRHSRGLLNPLVPFVLGVLTITVGNPYGLVAVIVVGVALLVETLVRGDRARLGHLMLAGVCVASSAVLVFLPLALTVPVTWRALGPQEVSNAYLVPDLGDLAGLSTVTYRPTMQAWFSSIDHVPSTYLAWFVLPLLPWLSWAGVRARLRPLTGLLLVGAVYLALTLSPSALWMFRWPLRVIEYTYLVVLVLVAVALTAGVRRDHVRTRLAASAGVVLAGGYLAWAGQPEFLRRHAAGVALVLALGLAAVLATRRWGRRGLATALVAGTVLVATGQAAVFWWNSPLNSRAGTIHNVATPHDLARLRAGVAPYRGTVLQVASVAAPLTADDLESGRVLFGNLGAAAGIDTVNRYTGIGVLAFSRRAALDYRGEVLGFRYDELWEPVAEGYDVSFVDAVRADTVVVQNSYVENAAVPPGWRVRLDDGTRTVLVRDTPRLHPADVSWASAGTTVTAGTAEPTSLRLDVTAPAGGGELLLARLAWPGYTLRVDGEPAALPTEAPAGLLAVRVPGGTHSVELTYRTPGLRLGLLVLTLGALLALAHATWYTAAARRHRAALADEARRLVDTVELPGDLARQIRELDPIP
ncbi:MAG TPA: hypothetical protein VGD67_28770 [Pseudonocardiaceae bacterium]